MRETWEDRIERILGSTKSASKRYYLRRALLEVTRNVPPLAVCRAANEMKEACEAIVELKGKMPGIPILEFGRDFRAICDQASASLAAARGEKGGDR